MKKKLAIAAIVCSSALLFTGCAANTDAKTGEGQVITKLVPTQDGGSVECVFWVPVDSTGFAEATGAQLSCDWANAS